MSQVCRVRAEEPASLSRVRPQDIGNITTGTLVSTPDPGVRDKSLPPLCLESYSLPCVYGVAAFPRISLTLLTLS